MHFVMRKLAAGALKLAGAMPGAECTVQTTTKIAAVGNFALQVYGVRQLAHQIMASKFDGLSTTVLPGKTG